MKLSTGFWQTHKETPADAEIPSHQLMLRAGLIHKSGSGLYNYLPFGLKSIQKVEAIVREEMENVGAHEILMAMVTPGELWKESGRWDKMTDVMCKFKDKKGSDICLSPTNEEAIVEIFRKSIKSYKNLPLNLFQVNTKFRDEIRPRFGLMRAREFIMKDAYSFHASQECLDDIYEKIFKAYERILKRMNLDFVVVEADGGAMASAGQRTHEFQILAEKGEDQLVISGSGYAANIERSQTLRKGLEFDLSGEPLKEVLTEGKSSIEAVCKFLGKPQSQSLKSLVYKSIKDKEEIFLLIQLLGDDELNELKLMNLVQSDCLSPATGQELESLDLPKGYIGVYGLKAKVQVLFDAAICLDAGYTIGALKENYHLTGFVPSRDYQNPKVEDLRLTKLGDFDLDGKNKIEMKRGIEAGHIFQLGKKYTESMNVTVLDKNGKALNPLMGCYGMGLSRIVAAAIEQHYDKDGIIWPISMAPAHIHFVSIAKSEEVKKLANETYKNLKEWGLEVVYDDRKVGPGFKFKDADLLGLPFQLVLGERDFLETGGFKLRRRSDGQEMKIRPEELEKKLQEVINYQQAFEDRTIPNSKLKDPWHE